MTDTNQTPEPLRLRQAIDASGEVIFMTDPDGVFTFVNQQFERLYGYGAREVVGLFTPRLLKGGAVSDEQYMDFWQRLKSGQPVAATFVNRTKDGRLLDVESTASPIWNETHALVGFLAIQRDITARKRAEEDARFHQTVLATERELTLDGILVVDDGSRVLSFNRRFAEMWGITEEILSTRTDQTLLRAVSHKLHDPEQFMELVRRLDDRHDDTSSDQIELSDGRIFDRYSAPMRHDDGRYYGRVWYFRDVTAASLAEAALRHERDRAQRALDVAEVILLSLDLQGRITLINRKGCSILQRDEHELLGCDWFETCLPPRSRTDLLTRFNNLLGGDLSVVQHSILTRSGEERLIEWRNTLMRDASGKVIGTFSSGTDITEQQRAIEALRSAEAQYQQAQKMEAIGRLAGGVAHDFNNLLTAILGYCDLVLADFSPADPRHLDIMEIQKAGQRAAGLTQQLLAFSRKQIIEPTLLDLNAIMTDMRSMVERLIGEDVKVVLHVAEGLAPVRADRGQVEQIVLNLAVNARDAMPAGGVLTIETAQVDLDEHYVVSHFAVKPGPHVVLTVSDNGVGMTPEVQSRLFEPFFTTKEVGKGTGLGLATVHSIVTRCGGTVNVYSEMGRGTSFRVYFPSTDAVGDAVTAAAHDHPASGAETVLVVEDAEALRGLAKRLLQLQGYSVLVAANADEALQVFERNASIDLLLTDVVMPGTSGPELTRQLMVRRPTLKVIYMSGYTEDAIVQHGVLKPGIAFLPKPFTAETLGRKIRETLAQ